MPLSKRILPFPSSPSQSHELSQSQSQPSPSFDHLLFIMHAHIPFPSSLTEPFAPRHPEHMTQMT